MKANAERACPYAGKCGACQTLNLDYDGELSMKMKREITLLGRFGHVEEILEAEHPTHYRNKAQYLFSYNGGRVNFGLYRASDGGIVHIDRCMMEDPELYSVARTVRKLIDKYNVKVYDGRRGSLRSVTVRKGFATGELLCALVTRDGVFPGAQELADELVRRHPKLVSVSVIVNSTDIPLWMDGEEYVLYGKGYLTDELCGCTFRVSAKAFYQINPAQTEVLYRTAAELAEIKKTDRILDAYCGIGTVGIVAAKGGCASLEGFDVNADAIRDAEENARANGIGNAEFAVRKDASFLLREGKRYDVIFADPPRAGCDKKFLAAVLKAAPEKLVYISCNPETLARDLAVLKPMYKVRKIQPVDLFPGTGHVETVCLLYKLESQPHIEVKLNMSELDLTKAEKKATYQEIKDYVMEHTGLKVSSLYIAQVKEKCGIREQENHRRAKSPDIRQPVCPPEKEKAIRDALRHFGMI